MNFREFGRGRGGVIARGNLGSPGDYGFGVRDGMAMKSMTFRKKQKTRKNFEFPQKKIKKSGGKKLADSFFGKRNVDPVLLGKRGQAAIFDGITLLLLASLSSALIFSFIGSYGVQESRVIRSAYILNYMQSVMKTFYHVDASTLSSVNNQERDSQGRLYAIPLYADLSSRPGGCDDLKEYRGSFTVADLLKRDLAEKVERLDDQFDGAKVSGITAVRCAFKELVKPFAFSGYYYGFDVIGKDEQALRYEKPEKAVTNFAPFTRPGGLSPAGICVSAQSPDVGSDVISVAAPAKVVYIDPDAPNGGTREIRAYTLRLCIWRPKA